MFDLFGSRSQEKDSDGQTLFTDGRVLYSQMNRIAFAFAFGVDSTAGIPSPMNSLDSLQNKGLIANDNSCWCVRMDLFAFEPPPDLCDPGRRPNVALEVDIVTLLDVRVTQFAAQPKR